MASVSVPLTSHAVVVGSDWGALWSALILQHEGARVTWISPVEDRGQDRPLSYSKNLGASEGGSLLFSSASFSSFWDEFCRCLPREYADVLKGCLVQGIRQDELPLFHIMMSGVGRFDIYRERKRTLSSFRRALNPKVYAEVATMIDLLYDAPKLAPEAFSSLVPSLSYKERSQSQWNRLWHSYFRAEFVQQKSLGMESLKGDHADVLGSILLAMASIVGACSPAGQGLDGVVRGALGLLHGSFVSSSQTRELWRLGKDIFERGGGVFLGGVGARQIVSGGQASHAAGRLGVLLDSHHGVLFADDVVVTEGIRSLWSTLPEAWKQNTEFQEVSRMASDHWRFSVHYHLQPGSLPECLRAPAVLWPRSDDALYGLNGIFLNPLREVLHPGGSESRGEVLTAEVVLPLKSTMLRIENLRRVELGIRQRLEEALPFVLKGCLTQEPNWGHQDHGLMFPEMGADLVPSRLLVHRVLGSSSAQATVALWPHSVVPGLHFGGPTLAPSLGVYGQAYYAREVLPRQSRVEATSVRGAL